MEYEFLNFPAVALQNPPLTFWHTNSQKHLYILQEKYLTANLTALQKVNNRPETYQHPQLIQKIKNKILNKTGYVHIMKH
jgi:hypothetical protein